MQKRESPFVIEKSLSNNIPVAESRKEEAYYGVIISSDETNKTTTKVCILFYPQGKIEEVAKGRLVFTEPPSDISNANRKFLENFTNLCPNSPLAFSVASSLRALTSAV